MRLFEKINALVAQGMTYRQAYNQCMTKGDAPDSDVLDWCFRMDSYPKDRA